MEYTIQPGDTIASVTQRLGTDWKTLKKNNPAAVGKSTKTGNWIVKAGKTVSTSPNFQEILAQQIAKQPAKDLSGQIIPAPLSRVPISQQRTSTPQRTAPTLQKGKTIWGWGRKQTQSGLAKIAHLDRTRKSIGLQANQQVRSLKKQDPSRNSAKAVVASWYGKSHQGRIMANGAPFDMNGATIAHRDIPIGTAVELENPATGEKATAIVTDRGPYIQGRDVDLSYGLAKRLSLARQGVGNLKMRVL